MLPIYNEAESVGSVIDDIVVTLHAAGISFEIIAINDGSDDQTQEILAEKLDRYPGCLRIARHPVNKGYGAAWRTGVRLARGRLVASMDSDGQHIAAEIPRMVKLIPPNDMVIGARTREYAGKWYRNIANIVYNRMASSLTGHSILDLTSGFRVMRRDVIQHYIDLYPSGFTMVPAITMILLKAGYTIEYLPVEVRRRVRGQSTVNLVRDGWEFFLMILKMGMLFDPLKIFLPAAASFGLLGLLGLAAAVYGSWSAGRPAALVSAIVLFVAAVFCLLMGMLAGQNAQSVIRYHGDEYIELTERPSDHEDEA